MIAWSLCETINLSIKCVILSGNQFVSNVLTIYDVDAVWCRQQIVIVTRDISHLPMNRSFLVEVSW